MSAKKKFVQVGLGARGRWYFHSLVDKYQKCAELVGLCDNNKGRLALAGEEIRRKGVNVPLYEDADFEKMIKETKPDCVIVTTRDCFHDKYMCRAMEMGCDVITEKPMTTDAEKCKRIIETKRKTKRRCVVTFNYRYSPPRTQIKDLLMTGVIGNVVSVDFHWLLNTSHGADYFRRWHRNKKNSGGLLVHKATHHFDLVNWWLSTVPESVFAVGKRNFYTPETARRYGLNKRSERCLDCPEKKKCRFYLDLGAYGELKSLYLDNEQYDGYFRDRCLFSKEIDIEDTMHVIVKYRSGATMSYSLHAFMPWEGYIIAFNGTRGRLEHKCMESVYVSGDGTVPGELLRTGTSTMIFPHFGKGYSVPIWEGTGGHGGGDDPLLDDLFLPHPPKDKYLRAADERAGAYSILTGVAANISIAEKREVIISDLVGGIDMPDYPPMPSPSEKLNPLWQHPSAKIAIGVDVKKFLATALQGKKSSITEAKLPRKDLFKITVKRSGTEGFHDIRPIHNNRDGFVYLMAKVRMKRSGKGRLLYGADGPVKVWINGKESDCRPGASNPIVPAEYACAADWVKGDNRIIFAVDTNCGKAWGIVAECKY